MHINLTLEKVDLMASEPVRHAPTVPHRLTGREVAVADVGTAFARWTERPLP
jgi:hypothetical protein